MQSIANGLVQGSIYALAAAGLVFIFGIVGVPHFAHGESVMLGGLTSALLVSEHGMNVVLAMGIGTVVGLALGVVLAQVLYWPMRRSPELALLAASFAVVLIVEAIATERWGSSPRVTPTSLTGSHQFLGAYIPEVWFVVIAAGVVFITVIELFVRYTAPGRAMRAISLNRTAALLVGVPVRRYSLLAFAIGSTLAGLAGALYSLAFGVSTTMGSQVTLDAFIVIIFAGLGSVYGAYLVGVGLGVVESVAGAYISTGYQNMFAFVFLVVVLVIRPQGVFHSGIAKE